VPDPVEPPVKPRIAIVYGTRPEAIKVSSLIRALKKMDGIHTIAISTQQHESLLADALSSSELETDCEIGEPDRTSVQSLISSIGVGLEPIIRDCDVVVVQGDTLSAFAGALAGFLQKKPVVHLEAGLRTSTLLQPHPEEGLRRAISRFATLHLAPTPLARTNLLNEGISSEAIVVIGNTSVDAIMEHLHSLEIGKNATSVDSRKYVVLTVHRRENWGPGLSRIARAVFGLSEIFPNVDFICPLHPNPLVRASFEILPVRENFLVIDPLPHDEFVRLLAGSQLILTDSGGIQEEATVLHIPVVILRDETERPEVITSGWGFIAGTEEEVIVEIGQNLLRQRLDETFSNTDPSPFGDGTAGEKAAVAIRRLALGAE
jgi:UDP-N-acetylglucosamine 2-epimerase (non-hydrolysing)